jgi:mitotic spindle assembly checkpoint protein MAD2B
MDLSDVIIEFLEVAIHQVLYYRKIYPSVLFESRIKYGIHVFQSRHPEMNAYIKQVLHEAKALLVRGLIERLLMTFKEQDRVIDIVSIACRLNTNSRMNEHLPMTKEQVERLEEELRSILLRITLLDSQLAKPGEGKDSRST